MLSLFSIWLQMMRAKRKEDLCAKMNGRPDEKEDDPQDVSAILEAKANLGDYNIKSTSNSCVLDKKQNHTKLEELLCLQLTIQKSKAVFNEKLLKLRDEKKVLVKKIRDRNERVLSIDLELKDSPSSVWDPGECLDIQEETDVIEDRDHSFCHCSPLQSVLAVILPETEISDPSTSELSDIEMDERKEKQLLLRHERSLIFRSLDAEIVNFDSSLYELRKHRFQLSSELKAAGLQLSRILQEWEILEGIGVEISDHTLTEKLQNSIATSMHPRSKTVSEKYMNEKLMVTIPISSRQMFVWEDQGKDPSTEKILTQAHDARCLVFPNQQLVKLRSRIGELKDEISSNRQRFNDLKKEKNQLEKASKLKEEAIKMQSERCDELQMLKFGQLVDIDALDEICVDSTGEAAVQEHVAMAERVNEQKVSKLHSEHRELQEKVLDLTNKSTSILSQIAELSEKQLRLEQSMKTKKNRPPNIDKSVTKMEDRECDDLTAVACAQARQLESLRQEIRVLKRKDCHIFAPQPQTDSHSSDPNDGIN